MTSLRPQPGALTRFRHAVTKWFEIEPFYPEYRLRLAPVPVVTQQDETASQQQRPAQQASAPFDKPCKAEPAFWRTPLSRRVTRHVLRCLTLAQLALIETTPLRPLSTVILATVQMRAAELLQKQRIDVER